MKRSVRMALLIVATFATAAAVWFAPEEAPPVTADSAERTADAQTSALPLDIARAALETEAPNLFSARSWFVPPPPPPVRQGPPPAPSAPPLPFSYIGRLQETPTHVTVFLARGEKMYAVQMGDIIDETYQVEALANGQLTLTYLPLKIRQSLTIGNDS